MQKERNVLYDNVKVFLICCVVLGHLGNRYADDSRIVAAAQFWIYLFHMPAFIYISGLFSKSTVKKRRWDKAVPYIFIFILMKMMNYAVSVFSKGIDNVSLDFFHENGIPWFALSMFWWYAITILIQNVDPKYVLPAAILLSVVSGYCEDVNSFLVIQRTLIFYPFFYAGYLTDPQKLLDFLKKWQIRVISAVVILVTVIISFAEYKKIYYWRSLFRGIKAYSQIKGGLQYEWGWMWRIAAYVISFILVLAIISVMPSIKSVFAYFGKKTLPVYVFHGCFITLMLRIPFIKNLMMMGSLPVNCIIFMAVIVFVTSLLPFDWITKKVMNVPKLCRKDPDKQND